MGSDKKDKTFSSHISVMIEETFIYTVRMYYLIKDTRKGSRKKAARITTSKVMLEPNSESV